MFVRCFVLFCSVPSFLTPASLLPPPALSSPFQQIIAKIGVHLTAAESQFIFKYLSSAPSSDGTFAAVKDLEAAILRYKPQKGKFIAD